MLVMCRIVDDQIHSDLACIPLDHDWAAFHQELKGENQPAEREQQHRSYSRSRP